MKTDVSAYLPSADDGHQTHLTPRGKHLKRKHRCNTQLACLNQFNSEVLPPTTLSCEQFSMGQASPKPTIITPANKKMSPSQQRSFASNPCLHPWRISTSSLTVQDGIEDSGTSSSILSQKTLSMSDTHSRSTQAENAGLKGATFKYSHPNPLKPPISHFATSTPEHQSNIPSYFRQCLSVSR